LTIAKFQNKYRLIICGTKGENNLRTTTRKIDVVAQLYPSGISISLRGEGNRRKLESKN